ncbi:bacteriocin immunity protein [Kitasatospora sp. NPDC092948]|uniref:bacteriocin immunity protein n=1 Tax=Kitasatospora sp. NPDC092948 TaxID=3364088 RepID=UPI0038043C4A
MDLRPELLPPPVSRERLAELCREIERIADLAMKHPEAVDEAVAAFNAMTGHDYGALCFAEYDGSRSLEDFAREAARPARPQVSDITRDELVEVVRRLLEDPPDSDNSDYYLRLLEANVSHPRVSDLLFHPPAELRNASAERIVEAALRYRPIAL